MAQNCRGDGKTGIEHLRKCISYCEEGEVELYHGLAWSGLGWGYHVLGDLEAARKHMEKGLKIQSDAGIPYLLSLHYFLLSMVHFDSGDLENAQICAEEGLKLAKNNNERWVEAMCRIFLGRVLGKADKSQSGTAEQYILQGIKVLDEMKTKVLCSQGYLILAELYASTGRRLKALMNLKKAQRMFKEMGMDYWLAMSKRPP